MVNDQDPQPTQPPSTPASERTRLILLVVAGTFVIFNLGMAYYLMFHR